MDKVLKIFKKFPKKINLRNFRKNFGTQKNFKRFQKYF